MSASSFASLICSKIRAAVGSDGSSYNSGTPSSCQAAIAAAVTEYFIAHVTVHAAYNGMTTSTPSVPDIVPDEQFKVIGTVAPLSTPGNFASWVVDLQSKIASGLMISGPGINGVVTAFQPFNPATTLTINQGSLKSAHEGSMKDPMQKTWQVVCQALMNWVNSAVSCNPAASAVAATRPGSVGTVTLMHITIT